MKHLRSSGWSLVFGLVALLVAASPAALAQVSTAGKLTGTVTDPQGAVIRGAQVTAKNMATLQESVVTSGSEGNWTVPSVSAGNYTITVTAQGFKTTVVQGV
ncbi:MAG: carboxypeptidase-like regulatory domain-containing protein, partial [Acidobacteriota bacterium]